jgi:hypothetical protein
MRLNYEYFIESYIDKIILNEGFVGYGATPQEAIKDLTSQLVPGSPRPPIRAKIYSAQYEGGHMILKRNPDLSPIA